MAALLFTAATADDSEDAIAKNKKEGGFGGCMWGSRGIINVSLVT